MSDRLPHDSEPDESRIRGEVSSEEIEESQERGETLDYEACWPDDEVPEATTKEEELDESSSGGSRDDALDSGPHGTGGLP